MTNVNTQMDVGLYHCDMDDWEVHVNPIKQKLFQSRKHEENRETDGEKVQQNYRKKMIQYLD